MTADHFTVSPAVLREHASRVRSIASEVDTAGDAANEVGLGGTGTYGVIGSALLLGPLHLFFGDATGLVKQAAALGDAYAHGLETNSDVYESVEKGAQAAMTKIHSDFA